MIDLNKFSKTDQRFERKFIIRELNNSEIISALYLSNYKLIKVFPNRLVNSIYFDNDIYDSVNQNLDGINDKIKFRVRWYGKKNIIQQPTLEIKIKKDFQSIKKNKSLNILDPIEFNSASINILTKRLKNILSLNLKPVISTHYNRIYLNSNLYNIRSTLDYNLHYHNLNCFYKNNFQRYLNYKVLELKYKSIDENHLKELAEFINIRATKSSKYINSYIDQNI